MGITSLKLHAASLCCGAEHSAWGPLLSVSRARLVLPLFWGWGACRAQEAPRSAPCPEEQEDAGLGMDGGAISGLRGFVTRWGRVQGPGEV